MLGALLASVLRTILSVLQVIVLLVVELVVAMLVYGYLNLYHVETFGALVRLAKSVLDAVLAQLDYWFPLSANAAYATLVGELGPKSILLLLIGLISGVAVRFLVRSIRRLIVARTAPDPAARHV
jgi:hypothetical protein